MARPRKQVVTPTTLTSTGDILDRFKDFPAIDVISRRFADPSDPGSLPILLKDEDPQACVNSDHQSRMKAGAAKCRFCGKPTRKWHVRWFNLSQEGRHAQMRAKGYVPVELAQLQDQGDVSDLYRSDKDTHVRRGDRGQEVLGYQPLEVYHEIQRRVREKANAALISKRQLKQDLAEAAGKELGSEAGDMIHDGEIKVESMTRSRSTLAEEAEAD